MFPGYISSTIIGMCKAKVGKDCSLLWNIQTSRIQRLTDKCFETFITSFPGSSFLCFFVGTPDGFSLTLFFIMQWHCLNSGWKGCCLAFGQHFAVTTIQWLLHSLFWVGRVHDRPLLLSMCRKEQIPSTMTIICMSLRLTYWNKLYLVSFLMGRGQTVISYHATTLCKYHWFSMNSFWPTGLRLLLCDVHNSLNTGPLLLLRIGGQACSVKSKRISSPINNQLQDCSPNDRS